MRPNVVVVTVDCLRQDFTVNDRAVTPYLDGLRARGTAFRECFASTTNTTPNVASLFTGTYAETHGVVSLREGRLAGDVPTLAACLRDGGYETVAAVTGPLVSETGLQAGFDRYCYREPDRELVGPWFDDLVETVERANSPFFLYLHLWELHDPIDVPADYDAPDYGAAPYTRMVSAVDAALERFHDRLPPETLLVLHGDHGESISWRQRLFFWPMKLTRDALRYWVGLDTRGLERRLNRALRPLGPSFPDLPLEEGHGEAPFDFVANVPLIASGPGVPEATVDAQCRQVDICPTILDYLDLPIPETVTGRSLLPPESVADRPAFMRACGPTLLGRANWQRCLRTPAYKYIEYPNRDLEPELYAGGTDDLELEDVAAANPEVVADLAARLAAGPATPSAAAMGVDDHLRDLGYL